MTRLVLSVLPKVGTLYMEMFVPVAMEIVATLGNPEVVLAEKFMYPVGFSVSLEW